jgi:DNA-damage-inducible protein D
MKSEEIKQLVADFESTMQVVDGVECWSARDLQVLLGYSKWENFEKVINKAKEACRNAGGEVRDHFPDVRKMVDIGSGTEREIADIGLTRYACYLIAQNGESRKPEISFAQTGTDTIWLIYQLMYTTMTLEEGICKQSSIIL